MSSVKRSAKVREVCRVLGYRIQDFRQDLELSQEALADRCGLHRTYIGQLERGCVNPTLATLLTIAGGLRVDPAELVRALPPVTVPGRHSTGPRTANHADS